MLVVLIAHVDVVHAVDTVFGAIFCSGRCTLYMVGVVALRALEVSRWQERHRVGWDAADGRNEGRNAVSGKRCSRETVSSTEHVKMDQGAITLVLDLAEAFARVSLPVVWAWATRFNFPRKIFAGAARVLTAPAESSD